MGIVGKAGFVKSNGNRHINHALKSLHEINDIFPREDFFSKISSCHKCVNNIEPLHTTYMNSNRCKSRVTEYSNNFFGASSCDKLCATNKKREEKISSDSSSTITGNNTNYVFKEANKSIPRRELGIPITSKLDSGNGFKKTLQRQSEKKVLPLTTSALLTTNFIADNVCGIAAGKSADIASSALRINKPLQKGSHHKVKCRTGKLCRIQSRAIQTTAGDMETVPANAKATMKFPNTLLMSGKISLRSAPAPESAKEQISASLSNTALTPTSTSTAALALSTLAQTLLDVSVIPQAWHQFMKLLHNSILGLTTSSRVLTTCIRITTKSTRVVSQLNKTSTASGAALTAAGTSTATTRCKAAAIDISSVHPSRSSLRTKFRLLPSVGATSFFTLLTLICLETVLLSTVSNCAKTFYMHWNTSNSM